VGLSGMRERAAIIGGTLTIDSEAGRGTRVNLRAPDPQKG
jgi:signal transduction histidine kinase